jgi:hypothetical protein
VVRAGSEVGLSISEATPDSKTTTGPQAAPPRDFTDYILAEMRVATLRARILQADLEAVGIALKYKMISPDQALALLHDCGALRVVGVPPDEAAP